MLLHSRFVIVDDKPHHLKGVKDALDTLRLDCHSKLYDDESVADWSPLPGTRILFLDLNLVTGATFATDKKVAFSALQEVITKIICPDSGPYGLVLWAENPDLDDLKSVLFERFIGEDARYLPVFFAALRKGDYIDTSDGRVIKAEQLRTDIMDRVSQSPQMKALLSWEADVSVAAGAVLRSIVDLVPVQARASDDFGNELGQILYRLAQAGAGINRAEENPREAINHVLVPILADRVTEHDPEGDARASWKSALTRPREQGFAPVPVQAAINTAIHISRATSPNSVAIQASDLGAVSKFPFADVAAALAEYFDLSVEQFCSDKLFGMHEDDWKKCSLRLVQIGASCDQAQPKDGPLLCLLGLEWPFDNADGSRANNARLYAKKSKKSGLEWTTPAIVVGDPPAPGKLSVFLNCALSVPRGKIAEWTPVYRLREELISKLTQEFARHISRPGVLTMSPDD
ncbi:MAG: hypothetical protein ACK5NN_06200 [Sphingomonadaceae bacterium]